MTSIPGSDVSILHSNLHEELENQQDELKNELKSMQSRLILQESELRKTQALLRQREDLLNKQRLKIGRRTPIEVSQEERIRLSNLKTKPIEAWIHFPTNLDDLEKSRCYEIISEKLQMEGYTGTLTLNAVVAYSDSHIPIVPNHLTDHFNIIHARNYPRPSGSKKNQESDIKIKALIRLWIAEHEAPQNTMLLTTDNGFKESIDLLRENGHAVLLVVKEAALEIEASSHQVWYWNEDFLKYFEQRFPEVFRAN